MLGRLKKRIFGRPRIEITHEFFGRLSFMGENIPEEDDYWEAELKNNEVKEPITILINAGKEGPTDKQVVFYERCVSDLDKLFNKCWPIFEADYHQWTGNTFSGNWRDDFELTSIEIPKDADENNEWTVGYYVKAANHYFTARFVNGIAKYNEIDG